MPVLFLNLFSRTSLNVNKIFQFTSRSVFNKNLFSNSLKIKVPSSPNVNLVNFNRFKNVISINFKRNSLFFCSPKSTHLALLFASAGGLYQHFTQAECHLKVKHSRLLDNNDQTVNFPWREFGKFLYNDLLYLFLAVLAALGAAIVNIYIPVTLGRLVDSLAQLSKDSSKCIMQQIQKPALSLINMYILQGALTFVYISLLSSVGERVASRLRNMLFNSLIQMDMSFYDSHRTGELIDRLAADVQDFKSSFKQCVSQGLKSITQTIGCAISLYMMSPTLTLVTIAVVPALVGIGTFFGSVLRTWSRQAQEQVARSTAVADEALSNVRTVRAFAMENQEKELFATEVEKSTHLNHKLGIGIGLFQGLSNITLNGIVLGTLYIGGYLMSTNQIRAGDLMSFMVATQTVQRSLAQFSILFGSAVRGVSAGARVFEYLSLNPTVSLTGGHTFPFHSMRGTVQFNDVSFSYPTRPNQIILENFNLTIQGGTSVALVAPSGAGKSTVAALLERFYEPTSGQITIDDYKLSDLDPSWLRGRTIGYINQEPVLFATTVRENIRYGRPDATDVEVMEAAEAANAHQFINSFPNGYDTVLGERGITVSGGQKQRIAIARALIKNPSILILDEATSALDAESEALVQEALDKIAKGRTVLFIAHRLSTIKDVDLICVIDKGRVVESGSHEDLKKKKGIYWQLIKRQENENKMAEGRSWFFNRG